jgi:hypothetical protein
MKNFVFIILTVLFTVLLANAQNNYKCNCKLVYGNKMSPIRITYFNDSLVMNELGYGAKDSTIKLLFNPSGKLEELYFKVNYRWREADTFLILNNVIGSRIGNFFYPYYPPDSLKKGDKFIRFSKFYYNQLFSDELFASVFYKMGDTIYNKQQIGYFTSEHWQMVSKSPIKEIIAKNLNDLPFKNNNTSTKNNPLDYFIEQIDCGNPDPNCFFCDYSVFKKGETSYKKEIDLIFLEGDCENFLKNKPTFLKELK